MQAHVLRETAQTGLWRVTGLTEMLRSRVGGRPCSLDRPHRMSSEGNCQEGPLHAAGRARPQQIERGGQQIERVPADPLVTLL